jgi:hypothetical protein
LAKKVSSFSSSFAGQFPFIRWDEDMINSCCAEFCSFLDETPLKAVGYTAGPAPLKYLGLGDLTVESSEVTWRMDPKISENIQRENGKLMIS